MKPPVFIVGCPRSGTSYLYHLLLSAGGFAEFRTQMNVFDVLEPIYGNLSIAKNKTKMMNDWLRSKAFKVSGLDAAEIKARVLSECGGVSDFLRIVMEEVARKQGVDRWIDSTPTNIPHLLRIKKDFPEARIVHIIRDGRDVALSLAKRGWSRPLPWDRGKPLLAAGLYWEWIVRKGRKLGAACEARLLGSALRSAGHAACRCSSTARHLPRARTRLRAHPTGWGWLGNDSPHRIQGRVGGRRIRAGWPLEEQIPS